MYNGNSRLILREKKGEQITPKRQLRWLQKENSNYSDTEYSDHWAVTQAIPYLRNSLFKEFLI